MTVPSTGASAHPSRTGADQDDTEVIVRRDERVNSATRVAPADHGGPLAGRTALVTGGSRGLGAAISTRLARAGARVALTGRDEADLRAVADRLANDPLVVVADLADPDGPRAVLEQVLGAFGRLDVLVNNAGRADFGPSEELTPEIIDGLLALNVRAPLLLAGSAAAHMAEHGGGSIVNISTGVAVLGAARNSLYGASKGALDAATRSLAAEWGPRQVRVNGIRPGLTRSDGTTAIVENDRARTAYEQTVPLGRIGEGDDVAEAVLFLAGPTSSYVTGQVLNVDGGITTTAVYPTSSA